MRPLLSRKRLIERAQIVRRGLRAGEQFRGHERRGASGGAGCGRFRGVGTGLPGQSPVQHHDFAVVPLAVLSQSATKKRPKALFKIPH